MKAIMYLLLALIPLTGNAQLLNGDFEDLNDTVPEHWHIADFGAGLSSDYTHSGNHSLRVWNWYYYSKGFATNGEGVANLYTDMVGAGTPATEKALRLMGYYYYDTTNTDTNADTAVIAIAYRKLNASSHQYDTVAFGRQYLLPTPGSQMVPFSVEIEDLMPGTNPDTVIVLILSSLNGFCTSVSAGNCLYLYVDGLKLENTTGIINLDNELKPIKLHPNPAATSVTVVSETSCAEWKLFNLSGKCVDTHSLHTGENLLDISAQPAGMYIAQLTHNGTVLGREKLVKH